MKKIDILVPELPESINNATVIKWNKKVGDIIQQDEILLELETEKVILEIPSPVDGILTEIIHNQGKKVNNKQILGYVEERNNCNDISNNKKDLKKDNIKNSTFILDNFENKIDYSSPSIRRKIAKNNNNFENNKFNTQNLNYDMENTKINFEKRVPMTPIRRRIAEKLLYTTQNVAMLTTFNEVNMTSIIHLRKKYCIEFEKKHKVRLGFMPFFVKSVVASLKYFPKINARIDFEDIVYYKNFNINIAVSTNTGLITPILKHADCLSMPDIEKKIQSFIIKSNTGKLKLSDLIGGSFTITNGGVFGSLFSTPIINANQSAILGIHAIKDRVVVINRKIKIAPMLYLALSYDHRLIDGKEAVGFLNMIKNTLEDFSRIIMDI